MEDNEPAPAIIDADVDEVIGKMVSVLQSRRNFPHWQRKRISYLVQSPSVRRWVEDDATIDVEEGQDVEDKLIRILRQRRNFSRQEMNKYTTFSRYMLQQLEEDIDRMVFVHVIGNSGRYRGLNFNRDTEEEVDTALRFFPRVLMKRRGPFNRLPIHCIIFATNEKGNRVCNILAVSFVDLFARIAIEFGSFEEQERGGLLIEDSQGHNTLQYLVAGTYPSYVDEFHQIVDVRLLSVLIRLRRRKLLIQNDIQHHRLLQRLCKKAKFAERRFRFFIEWDPSSLLQTSDNGMLPLHWVIPHKSIEPFRIVFGACIRYYPFKKGIQLLFRKHNHGWTPFRLAVERYKRNAVMNVVEETLALYENTATPLNINDAIISAAIDDNIHVDCVYFLMRRRPDVLINLLERSTPNIARSTNNADISFNEGIEDDVFNLNEDNGDDNRENGGFDDDHYNGVTGNDHRHDISTSSPNATRIRARKRRRL